MEHANPFPGTMTLDDVRREYLVQTTSPVFMGRERTVASMLSDVQELVERGASERARQMLNVAKAILFEGEEWEAWLDQVTSLTAATRHSIDGGKVRAHLEFFNDGHALVLICKVGQTTLGYAEGRDYAGRLVDVTTSDPATVAANVNADVKVFIQNAADKAVLS